MSKSARCAVVAVLGLALVDAALRPVAAQDPHKAQIDALRNSMEKYKDYKVAVRDLYLSTVGCVHYAGEKIPHHMEYAKGAMGVHFVNLTVRAPRSDEAERADLRARRQGTEAGRGRVARPSYARHQAAAPSLRPNLHGPDGRARTADPEGIYHYDLHAWMFKDNPLGMFAPTNPKVKCKGPFAILEKTTKMVAGP